MYFLGLLIIDLVVAFLAFALFPRRVCLALGVLLLLLGVAAPAGIWTYGSHFISGDPSGYGMLGTICAVLFAPPGILITLLGLFKGD